MFCAHCKKDIDYLKDPYLVAEGRYFCWATDTSLCYKQFREDRTAKKKEFDFQKPKTDLFPNEGPDRLFLDGVISEEEYDRRIKEEAERNKP